MSESYTGSTPSPGEGLRASRIILVVEDDEQVLEMLSKKLGTEGDVVLTAESPAQAEYLLKRYPVSHLVCDRQLGKHLPPGERLILDWRERYPSIHRALLVTGTAIAQSRDFSGVDCVLPKPVQLQMIRAELEE